MDELLFPALTGLSLVLAGILIGYFLWFRDRAEQLQLARTLATDNERLGSELLQLRQQSSELENKLETRNSKTEHIQQLCDDLMESREQAFQRSRELESELSATRRSLDETREQLTAECQLRSQSETGLHRLRQQHLESTTDQQSKWKSDLDRSNARAQQLQRELKQSGDQQQSMAEKLHASKSRIAELESELAAQQQLLNKAKQNVAGLEQEHVSLESSVRSQIELLNESRGQAASANSARQLAEELLASAKDQNNQLQAELEKARETAAALNSVGSRCAALEESLKNERARCEEVSRERSSIGRSLSQLQSTFAGVQKRSENQESTIRALRQQVAEHVASLDAAEETQKRIASLIGQRDQALEQVQLLGDEIRLMKKHARANEQTIRNLRRERGAVLMRNRPAAEGILKIHQIPAAEESPADQISREYGGTTRVDPDRGILFAEPPRFRDDLKLIYGVAHVLERKLNDAGIYTFRQIMEWDDRAIEEFSELLVFKDRIVRDDWRRQATRLYRETAGSREVA